MISRLLCCLLILFLCCTAGIIRSAQRDHLTELEADRVREAQAIDLRTDVFIKVIERRMILIMGKAAEHQKDFEKDQELWGDPPTGTKLELLNDIGGILDEAITNIDDAHGRTPKNPLLTKALNNLSRAAERLLSQLSSSSFDNRSQLEIKHINNQVEEIFAAAKKAGGRHNQ